MLISSRQFGGTIGYSLVRPEGMVPRSADPAERVVPAQVFINYSTLPFHLRLGYNAMSGQGRLGMGRLASSPLFSAGPLN